jgi:membrane-bound metal-dependent hydrolase YbcI (DUF457 family)
MFVGHFAVGFAGKRWAPKVSLATLILAAVLADILWIVFFPIGIEQVLIEPGIMPANSLNLVHIPYSHSLLMDAVWGGLFAWLYFFFRRDARGASMIFAAVVSHWFLDFISHRPDMPLIPGMDLRVGLGLWNSRAATFVVEGALWVYGVALYLRATRPKGRAAVYAFWPMIIILTAFWLVSLRGDPPSSLSDLAIVNSVFLAIFFAWAAWMNRSRSE